MLSHTEANPSLVPLTLAVWSFFCFHWLEPLWLITHTTLRICFPLLTELTQVYFWRNNSSSGWLNKFREKGANDFYQCEVSVKTLGKLEGADSSSLVLWKRWDLLKCTIDHPPLRWGQMSQCSRCSKLKICTACLIFFLFKF